MGFTTGFLGGLTLTTTLAYLALAVHERTRLRQGELLRQQALILDLATRGPDARAALMAAGGDTARRQRSAIVEPGLQERLRERWNAELEGNLRKVYGVDWKGVREEMEDRVAGLWGRAMEGTREGVKEVEKKVS